MQYKKVAKAAAYLINNGTEEKFWKYEIDLARRLEQMGMGNWFPLSPHDLKDLYGEIDTQGLLQVSCPWPLLLSHKVLSLLSGQPLPGISNN